MLRTLMVGAAAGLHVATWGMYQDSLYEGFSWRKFARSVLVGAGAACLVQAVLHFNLAAAAGMALLFGVTYALERATVEWHKSFIRVEDQSKYHIPMAFAVGRRVVRNRMVRVLAGLGYATVLVTTVMVLFNAGELGHDQPVATALLIGSIGGWVSAFGGAWKDAPTEGFDLLKFFRSPAISAVYGLALATLTSSYVVIAFGALGFTIATIETHKKFGRSRRGPGKFAGKPLAYPAMLRFRRPFAAVYAALWLTILATLMRAVVGAMAETPAGALVAME